MALKLFFVVQIETFFCMFLCLLSIIDSNFVKVLTLKKALELSVSNETILLCHFIFELDSSNALTWLEYPKNKLWKKLNNFK